MSGYTPGRRYANPPIEEAIFQLELDAPVEWTVATPGLAYATLRGIYPTTPEAQQQMSASVGQDQTEMIGLTLQQGATRFIFKDATFNRFAILSDRFQVVGTRRPYHQWPELRGRLEQLVDLTKEIYGDQRGYRSVSIRYINRIVIPSGAVDTDEYFTVPVPTALGGKAPFRSFISQVESALPNETTARIAFASLEPQDGGTNNQFLLDLDFKRPCQTSNLDEILAIADELKNEENREFEARITDRTRSLFDGEN
ncbi:TIGR04255 family protein [Propioniciclava tarda]|nr:TIGR04255 family protein [Propioniciclava tarda]SMO58984.1 TIGR04255 family protein [Propioniciclava tarda]